jgi:hypothetical protein
MIDVTKYLNQTATLKTQNGHDEYGTPQIGSGTTVNTRFVTTSERTTDSVGAIGERGTEITIDAKAWLEPDTTVKPTDIVDFGGDTYIVVRVSKPRTRVGDVNHRKLELARTKQ